MASYEKGSYNYKGNTIYYDETQTNAAFKQISTICGEVSKYSEKVKTDDMCFDGFPQKYAVLFPDPRYASIAPEIEANLNDIQSTVTTKMNDVIASIVDYCNGGDFSEHSEKVLDNLLASMPASPKGNPGGDPGSGPSSADDSAIDENLTANEEVADGIQNNVPLEDATTNNDEEIVLGEIEGASGQYSSEAVVPFTNSDETLEVGADGVEGIGGTDSDLGTSLFGSSSFSVPSMLSSEGKVDRIKGAGVLGAAGVAVAAATAIGGKVFYDKKHNDEEDDDDMFDEDVAKLNEESGSDLNSGFMSGLNSVDFKNELLNESEGDE